MTRLQKFVLIGGLLLMLALIGYGVVGYQQAYTTSYNTLSTHVAETRAAP